MAKSKYFKLGQKCAECDNPVNCRCFDLETEYEDDKGNTQGGVYYFCSVKCVKKFSYKYYDGDYPNGHNPECEIFGEMKENYVKMLQKRVQELEKQTIEREHYWHDRVREVCKHKELVLTGEHKYKTINRDKEKKYLCLDCSQYFKNKKGDVESG